MGKKKNKKDLQKELKDSVNKVWLAGLGALSAAEEEGSKLFKSLVEKGEAYQKRGEERIEDVKQRVEDATDKAKERATSTFDKIEEKVDDMVAAALRRAGVPGRDEIATLTKRVEELTAVVDKLKPAKRTTTRKPAAAAATTEKSA